MLSRCCKRFQHINSCVLVGGECVEKDYSPRR